MNESSVNPYEPTVVVGRNAERLCFEGTIDASDYAALLPKRDFESLLFKLLFGLLLLTDVLLTVATAALTAKDGWSVQLIPVGVLAAICLSGTAFLIWYRRPMNIAKRRLRLWPELLCNIRGQFEATGVSYFDGQRHHWMSSSWNQCLTVSGGGIRLSFDDKNPFRYLALTPRLFDFYEPDHAVELKRSWNMMARRSSTSLEDDALKAWKRVHAMPGDAVSFQGQMTIESPNRTPEALRLLKTEVAVTAAVFVFAIFASGWFQLLLLATGVFCLVSCFAVGVKYFRGRTVMTWYQSGWISATEIALYWDRRGFRITMAEFVGIEDHGDALTLIAQANTSIYLSRQQVSSDTAWQSVRAFAGAPLYVSG